MAKPFEGFDFSKFWDNSKYATENYVSAPFDDELLASIEEELGVKLPASYVAMMKVQNGGIPHDRCFPTTVSTSWAEDHVAISGIFGIGRERTYSLCGGLGSLFMQEEWDYPDIGVCICSCPSAGHDMIMLDYSSCDNGSEPQVVHVDQENDFEITFLAEDFESFIRGLVNEKVYDTSAEDLKKSIQNVEAGSFSTLLASLIASSALPGIDSQLRNICLKLTKEKGFFALHADELSHLVYDVLFYLYTESNKQTDMAAYLTIYPKMLALCDGEFSTHGYAPGFIDGWLKERLAKKQIKINSTRAIEFSNEYSKELVEQLSSFA